MFLLDLRENNHIIEKSIYFEKWPTIILKDILPQNEKIISVFLLLCSQVNWSKHNIIYYLED